MKFNEYLIAKNGADAVGNGPIFHNILADIHSGCASSSKLEAFLPGGSVIIIIIMIRTRSQMENEPHEKVFQEDRMIKRAHRLTSLRTLHKDETRKNLPKFMYVA